MVQAVLTLSIGLGDSWGHGGPPRGGSGWGVGAALLFLAGGTLFVGGSPRLGRRRFVPFV